MQQRRVDALVNGALSARFDDVVSGVLDPRTGSASSRDACCQAHR